jgi:hypothetical protein
MLDDDACIPQWRLWTQLAILCVCFLLSFVLYLVLAATAPVETAISPLIPLWILAFLPYFAVCAFVLRTKPAQKRWLWAELTCILVGAVLFRVLLLNAPPDLSRDVWRYLWDGRMIVHGYSPYVYVPADPVLVPLHDIVFSNARFRDIVTNYPPGAELIFVLGYLLTPQSLLGMKSLFFVLDITTCLVLVRVLFKKRLDPRYVLLYAWCPLPIVEFAMQGHSDVLAVFFLVLAFWSSQSEHTKGRMLTGFLLGMAVLTRLYPLLLLPAFLRRRDWAFLVMLGGTILLGYLPFLILGHGQAVGFFLKYASEQGGNDGILQHLLQQVSAILGVSTRTTILIEYGFDALLLLGVACVVLILRSRNRISTPVAILFMLSTVFAISPHIYPWYIPVFLPWIALEAHALQQGRLLTVGKIALALLWLYVCDMPVDYLLGVSNTNNTNWLFSTTVIYGPTSIYLVMSVGILVMYLLASRTHIEQSNPVEA